MNRAAALPQATLLRAGVAATIVAAMYFAKPFLLPLLVAALLTFALSPLVWLLGRIRLPRVAAVLVAVLLAGGAISVIGYFIVNEVVLFTAKLPDYTENIRRKLEGFRSGSVLGKASEGISKLEALISRDSVGPSDAKGGAAVPVAPEASRGDAAAWPVRIVQKPTGRQLAREYLGPLVEPLATVGVIVLLVVFLLVYKDDLRDRFIRIVAGRRLAMTTHAIEDASARITRYLLSNLLVNGLFAIPIGFGLYFLGVPNAFLWGTVAALLRFIPYLGVLMGVTVPLLLAFAVFDGWLEVAMVGVVFLCTELVIANVLEPWLYGRNSGLSPVGVVIASFFWAWLWGIPGLLLAIPVTLSLAVAGRYVPSLGFLTILFGEARGLTSEERFYQRLIARDTLGAGEVADEFIRSGSALQALFGDVVLPALARAEEDARADVLDAEAALAVEREVRELCEEQATLEAVREATAGAPPPSSTGEVVYVAAAGGLDALAGELLGVILGRTGVKVLQVGGGSFAAEVIEILRTRPQAVVCVGALSAASARRMRYLCMRLRIGAPGSRIVAAIWGAPAGVAEARRGLEAVGADRAALGLQEGVAALQALSTIGTADGPRKP